MPLAYAGSRVTAGLLSEDYTDGSATGNTVTAATITDLSPTFTIPAGDPQPGTAYRLTCFGTGTWGSTAQQLQLEAYVAGAAITNAGIPAATFNTSEGFAWKVTVDIVIATTGTGGTYTIHQDCAASTTAASSRGNTPQRNSSGNAINTTVSNAVVVRAVWASMTGAPTITCDGAVFEKLGG